MWNPYHMAIVDMAATQQRAAVAGPAPRPPVEPAQPQQVGRGEPQQQAARKPPHGPQGRRDRRGGARRPLGKQVPYKPPPQLVAAMGAVHGEVRRTGELRRQQLQQQLEAEQLEAMVAAQQQQQQHAKKEADISAVRAHRYKLFYALFSTCGWMSKLNDRLAQQEMRAPQEPPKMRRVMNMVIQQLAEHRRIELETALARRAAAEAAGSPEGEGEREGGNLFDGALAQPRQEEQPQQNQPQAQPQQPEQPEEEEFKMRNPSVAQVKPEPGPKAAARNPRLGLQIADLGKKNPKAKPERVRPLVKPQAPTRARAAAGVGAGAAAAAGAVARSERRRRRRARQKAAGAAKEAAKEAPPPPRAGGVRVRSRLPAARIHIALLSLCLYLARITPHSTTLTSTPRRSSSGTRRRRNSTRTSRPARRGWRRRRRQARPRKGAPRERAGRHGRSRRTSRSVVAHGPPSLSGSASWPARPALGRRGHCPSRSPCHSSPRRASAGHSSFLRFVTAVSYSIEGCAELRDRGPLTPQPSPPAACTCSVRPARPAI